MIKYIKTLDEFKISVRILIIKNTINFLLAEVYINFNKLLHCVEFKWLKCFLDYKSELFKRKQKLLAAIHKNAHNLRKLKEYFEKFWKMFVKKSIILNDI